MSNLYQMADQALRQFRAGCDTVEIADRMQVSESRASRLIWAARCREKGLPATFLDAERHVKQIAPRAA